MIVSSYNTNFKIPTVGSPADNLLVSIAIKIAPNDLTMTLILSRMFISREDHFSQRKTNIVQILERYQRILFFFAQKEKQQKEAALTATTSCDYRSF